MSVGKVPGYATLRICGKSIEAEITIADNNRTGNKQFLQ